MDCEKLIAAVFKRKSLWDKRLKSYNNRNLIQKLWKEIADEMEIEEHILRRKWKYFRDQYAVEFGKLTRSRSQDSSSNGTVKWPFFQHLFFLKDIVKPRIASGSCLATAEITESKDSYNNDTDNDICNKNIDVEIDSLRNEESVSSDTGNISSQEMNDRTTKRKRNSNSWNEDIVKIEQQELQYLHGDCNKRICLADEDEHISFFRSLLSHVRKIPSNRILSFRGRVQQLVDEYVYDQCTPSLDSPHYSGNVDTSLPNYSGSDIQRFGNFDCKTTTSQDKAHEAYLPNKFDTFE